MAGTLVYDASSPDEWVSWEEANAGPPPPMPKSKVVVMDPIDIEGRVFAAPTVPTWPLWVLGGGAVLALAWAALSGSRAAPALAAYHPRRRRRRRR